MNIRTKDDVIRQKEAFSSSKGAIGCFGILLLFIPILWPLGVIILLATASLTFYQWITFGRTDLLVYEKIQCPHCDKVNDVINKSLSFTCSECEQKVINKELPDEAFISRSQVEEPVEQQSVSCPLCGTDYLIPTNSDYCKCTNCGNEF